MFSSGMVNSVVLSLIASLIQCYFFLSSIVVAMTTNVMVSGYMLGNIKAQFGYRDYDSVRKTNEQ